jgi:hypothetical protein
MVTGMPKAEKEVVESRNATEEFVFVAFRKDQGVILKF